MSINQRLRNLNNAYALFKEDADFGIGPTRYINGLLEIISELQQDLSKLTATTEQPPKAINKENIT
jgi:hypothetical protein